MMIAKVYNNINKCSTSPVLGASTAPVLRQHSVSTRPVLRQYCNNAANQY